MQRLVQIAGYVFLFAFVAFSQSSDAALRGVTEKDRVGRTGDGKLMSLSAAEHFSRGKTYFDNRQFPESREHFSKILELYPNDANLAGALFMTGRSYYWERDYARAITYLDRVAREFPDTLYGREGLSFSGACHVRLGKNQDAARIYEKYTVMYPDGERVDSAYLNIIDALRESGDYEGAKAWIEKTRQKFSGTGTETNALQALVRLNIHRAKWDEAEAAANSMLQGSVFSGSMTSVDEIKYLKGFALEKAGKKQLALDTYASIGNSFSSYYSGLASDRLAKNGGKMHLPRPLTAKQRSENPLVYRTEILQFTKKHKIDPRFILAIMKQESSFRPTARSPAAARGLLQLVLDTAIKYKDKAGFPNLQPDDLYEPRTNIAIASEYIGDLKDEFNGLYEAVAASYNGGEDNAARWLARSKPKDPGIFASEVGFSETKNYVFKVMNNFRIYRELYDENLIAR
jgi:soluble lytic murein transglycosylase